MTRRKDRYQPRAASASQSKTLKTYACACQVVEDVLVQSTQKCEPQTDHHICSAHERSIVTWFSLWGAIFFSVLRETKCSTVIGCAKRFDY